MTPQRQLPETLASLGSSEPWYDERELVEYTDESRGRPNPERRIPSNVRIYARGWAKLQCLSPRIGNRALIPTTHRCLNIGKQDCQINTDMY